MLIAGLPVRDVKATEFIRYLDRCLSNGKSLSIGFVNHHFVVTCRGLKERIDDPSATVLVNDGIGMQIAALLTHGRGFRQNMNGTDFLPQFLRLAKSQTTIYLLGGQPSVVEKAAAVIGAMPRRRVVGYMDGYSLWSDEAGAIRAINDAAPDILLLGLGNPMQEAWILRNRHALEVKIVFAVGALFEWMTEAKNRAPAWIRSARMEWLYRLVQEPRRLAKRYSYEILLFFWIVWTERDRRAACGRAAPEDRRSVGG